MKKLSISVVGVLALVCLSKADVIIWKQKITVTTTGAGAVSTTPITGYVVMDTQTANLVIINAYPVRKLFSVITPTNFLVQHVTGAAGKQMMVVFVGGKGTGGSTSKGSDKVINVGMINSYTFAPTLTVSGSDLYLSGEYFLDEFKGSSVYDKKDTETANSLSQSLQETVNSLGATLISHGYTQEIVYYVRTGATGANNGADWNNAYVTLPSTLKRAATYYIAAGTYGAQTFADPLQGTQMITITSATLTNHGTDTGWSSSYAGQALFLGETVFDTGYYKIDGQQRGSDWRSGYTIRFWNRDNNVDGAAIHLYAGHITLRYVEVQGTTDQPIAGDTTGDTGIENHAQITDLYVGYSYIHETGNTQFQLNYGSSDRFTCEYNYIYKNHTAQNDNHDEAFALTFSNSVIRFNFMQDIVSSGIICDAAGGTPSISNWQIYGNVFFWSAAYQTNPAAFLGNGCVGFFGEHYYGHFYFYNNTIAGITNAATQSSVYQAGVMLPGTNTQYQIENNIWYGCQAVSQFGSGGNTVDYNSYLQCAFANPYDTGSHTVRGSSNPFVNVAASDFRLTGATAPGVSLSPPYNTDLAGNVRGADGVWDRGAYEFNANNPGL
jgi:hypothetical protein